jgi:uncharacterized protein (DUF1778 family)
MNSKSTEPTTLSIRLLPEERRLIDEAAKAKGWKAANFLRVTALERAAQVLNLSRPTSFDFSGAAKRIAEVLVAPRTAGIVDNDLANEVPFGPFREGPIATQAVANPLNSDHVRVKDLGLVHLKPSPLTDVQVDELQNAMRLGGQEFAAALIVECHRLTGGTGDPNLPPPIDPQNLKN